MPEINILLFCLQPILGATTFRQLTLVCEALLMMQGGITMLGISRWTQPGGSYRTLQRFFLTPIHWGSLNWALIRPQLSQAKGAIVIAGDATIVTKSGKQIQPKPPTVKPPKNTQQTSQQKPRPRGRPKGSKNKNRREVVLNTEMTQVQSMLNQLLALIGETLRSVYFVYDGAFGNNAAVQMPRQVGLHLVSKLRNNSALYFEWKGTYAGKGRRRHYGSQVDYKSMNETHLVSEVDEKGVRCRTYQFRAVHKKFADVLNVVVSKNY